MAFAHGTVPATSQSVLVHIQTVYATQFSLGDPNWEVAVTEDSEDIIATITYSLEYMDCVKELLSSRELEAFDIYDKSATSTQLVVGIGEPISPYGVYIAELFARMRVNDVIPNFTSSTGDTFKILYGDDFITFRAAESYMDRNKKLVWVSRKDFMDSLSLF